MAASRGLGLLMLCMLGLAAGTMAQRSLESCRDGLDRQNMYRKNHGVGSLQWDDSLFGRASDIAEQSANRGCSLDGFNAAMWQCQGRNCASCPSVADRWYWAFRDNFKFDVRNLYTDNLQSFGWWGAGSAMLWNGAKKVGCAKATGSNCMVFVCLYDTGNIQNNQAFKDNIFPEGGSRNNMNSDSNNNNNNGELPQCAQWRRENKCDAAFSNDVGQSKLIREWCPISCRGVPLPTRGAGPGISVEIPTLFGNDCRMMAQQGKCARGNTWRNPSTGVTKEVSEWCWSACKGANSNNQPQPTNNNNNNMMQPNNNNGPQPRPGDVLWYCGQWKASGWCLPGWTGQDLQGRTRPVLELCRATCSQP